HHQHPHASSLPEPAAVRFAARPGSAGNTDVTAIRPMVHLSTGCYSIVTAPPPLTLPPRLPPRSPVHMLSPTTIRGRRGGGVHPAFRGSGARGHRIQGPARGCTPTRSQERTRIHAQASHDG